MALEALIPASLSSSYLWPSLLALLILSPVFTLLYDITLCKRMPPGPPPLPFIGNKHQLPTSQPWHQFAAWSRTYGPIFTLWIGRRPTVILSDPLIAAELLEKRSAKYSSRPRMPYGKPWLARRKLLHQALTPRALRLYKPVQHAEAARLCAQLSAAPASFEKLIERFTASVVFSVAYGHRIDSLDAAVIAQRFEFMQYSAGLNVPGKYLGRDADIQAHGRREAAANVALVEVVRADMARAKRAGKELPDSLCKMLLELRGRGTDVPLSDRDFSFIPASLFGAGSDTTASTLCTALLALVTHPHVLVAAHRELDEVEVLRWRPVAVLGGTPHASTEDDVFEGYYIPAGTTVLGNSWAINLNEEYYPEPHMFEPLRFHDDVEKRPPRLVELRRIRVSRATRVLGGRRRICPGAGLAENSVWIVLAKVLWAFDVGPVEGRTYDTFAYTDGFNIRRRSLNV
ncbi:putative cytochrome p450 protein [Botryosphaeria dothidea]|uniref:Cytochrome p450 protein n=1 Tax=Botryosphaeria dothidea TaxID=55169 RepID=A0A8H4IRD9_9PEZI|nr:putative cytochrome p450 protein [Botryosphaeria dothidea]